MQTDNTPLTRSLSGYGRPAIRQKSFFPSKRRKPFRTMELFRLILTVILGICFSLQVWTQVLKFLKHDTVFTSTKNIPGDLRLPTISFCAQNGFKFDVLEKHGLPKTIFVFSKIRRATIAVRPLIWN